MIDKMKNSLLNLQATSVYNFNEFSLTDLLNKFFTTINQCVDSSNQSLDFLTWLKGEGLPSEVEKELNIMYEDGRITDVINTLSGNLNNKLIEINEEIVEINSSLEKNIEEFNSIGINPLFPPKPLEPIVADGITDDSEKLNNIIEYVSSNGKKLILPPKTIAIAKPLILPTSSLKWGIEISGIKSETKYQNLGGSKSTVLKAIAPMDYMITNRSGEEVGYYNVIKNIVIDGNNLSKIGYVNGYQDKLIDSTVINCIDYGISLGSLTNMTIIKEVTITRNKNGVLSDGENTTLFIFDKCTIRENTENGIDLFSSLGGTFNECVIESNGGRGINIIKSDNAIKFLNGLKLNNCYWENNTDYDIYIDRLGTVSATNINIINPYINGKTKAININYGDYINIDNPTLTGTPTTLGYFIVENGNYISIKSNENVLAKANLNISGLNAEYVNKIMNKTVGTTKGYVLNNVIKAPFLRQDRIALTNDITLTPYQVSETILTNNGQVNDVNVTLPIPNEMYHFKVICATNSNFKIKFIANQQYSIYYNGETAPKNFVQTLNPKIGDSIEFYGFRDGNGTYCWLVELKNGVWESGL